MKIINNNILVSEYSIFEEYAKRNWKWILINTVNCEGFMGKWLALEFKIRFWSDYFLDYENKCNTNKIKVWNIDYYNKNNLKVINFPTKNLYKFDSKILWIEDWLNDLILKIENWLFDDEIIYMPKLWTSQWWLRWEDVYLLIKDKLLKLRDNKVKFIICEDFEPWEIEKSTISKLKNYTWNKISDKTLNSIKDNFYKIKRLRDILNIKWVWEKTYKEILLINNEVKLFN